MSHLFMFQIGPVQAFIAQARRTQDLAVGSKLLSWLARHGWEAAKNSAGFEAIYPSTSQDDAPHKFAFKSDADPHQLASAVREAIDAAWSNHFAEPIFDTVKASGVGQEGWEAVFERQAVTKNWLEFYWVAVPLGKNYKDSYGHLSRAFAQRKALRHFVQVEEGGEKCTLTGAQSALPLNWDGLRRALNDHTGIKIRANERLGTMALIKRLVADEQRVPPRFRDLIKDFKSSDTIASDDPTVKDLLPSGKRDTRGYLAVLHMDGDKMGDAISKLETIKAHQQFTERLSAFAGSVAGIIKAYGGRTGQLVYAGGDDVLALLPLKHVLPCADAIRRAFEGKMGGLTMSAGIAITPHDLPLDQALEYARKAEKMAKNGGRNAVAIIEAHGSQEREAVAHWDEVIDLMAQAQVLFSEGRVSAKVAYDLQGIAHDMGGDNPQAHRGLAEARKAELKRLLKRRTAEKNAPSKEELASFAEAVALLGEKRTWTDAANWLILARFLATAEEKFKPEKS
jgi:CRISPR-associated protein Cmr2